MNRFRIPLCVAVFLITTAAIAAPAMTHLPAANTRDAVLKYVQSAATIIKKSGPSCATFASSEWKGGDYYIFVLGPDDKTVCHPQAAMIGKAFSEIVNAEGDKVGEKIVKTGAAGGKGWVDYRWSRPGQTVEEPKSSYVMGFTGSDGKHYIVGAGGYNLKE